MVRLLIILIIALVQFMPAQAKNGAGRRPPNANIGANFGGPNGMPNGMPKGMQNPGDDDSRPVKPAAAPPVTNGRSLKQQRAGSEIQKATVTNQPSANVTRPEVVVAPPPVFEKSLLYTPEELEKIRLLFQAYLNRQKSPQPAIDDKSAKVDDLVNKLTGQDKELPPAPASIYLNSVLFHSADSAVAWINGMKYELGAAQNGIKLIKVTPGYAELEWQADGYKDVDFTDWSVVFPEARGGDNKKVLPASKQGIKVNSEAKTIDVILRPNQFLDIQEKSIKEGRPASTAPVLVAGKPVNGAPGSPINQSMDERLKPLQKMVEALARPDAPSVVKPTSNSVPPPTTVPEDADRNSEMEPIPAVPTQAAPTVSPTAATMPPATATPPLPSTPLQNPQMPPLPNQGSALPPLSPSMSATPPLPAAGVPALPPLKTNAVTAPANEVKINASPNGHYDIDAKINNQMIRFRVDTGATFPVISKEDASRLGINVDKLQYNFEAKIADGTIVKSAQTVVGTMNIQGMDFKDVTIMVANGNFPQPLLGISFLNTINWQMHGGVMTITK